MNEQHLQIFRVPYSSTETVAIESQMDNITGERVVLWSDVQQVFQNARYVCKGESLISFLVDNEFEELQPLRILYHPGEVLDVALDTID
ncbi:hypothetical protein BGX26_007571 [Mortierella sp. AD094]|nr:hypothetical protein BGX26_007571 [Mortierella sp. AD094]